MRPHSAREYRSGELDEQRLNRLFSGGPCFDLSPPASLLPQSPLLLSHSSDSLCDDPILTRGPLLPTNRPDSASNLSATNVDVQQTSLAAQMNSHFALFGTQR